MILGLVAAAAWGFSDLYATVVSRRIGSYGAVVTAHVVGSLTIAAVAVLLHPTMPPSPAVFLIPLAGVFGLVGYLTFYRGLQIGPIAIVSPIGAGYGAITVLLAVVLLRESLPPGAALGVALTLFGVVLASLDPRMLRRRRGEPRGGVPYGIAAAISFGVGAYALGVVSKDFGWLPALLLFRLGLILFLAGTTAVTRDVGFVRSRGRDLALAGLVGLLDIVGLAAYARESQLGLVSVAGAASATYPLVPILAGVTFFREMINGIQWLGVVLVIGGLVLLGVAA